MSYIKKYESWKDWFKTNDPISNEEKELNDIINSTLSKGFDDYDGDTVSHSEIVGLFNYLTIKLVDALSSKTWTLKNGDQGGRQMEYDFHKCDSILSDWMKENHLSIWKAYYNP